MFDVIFSDYSKVFTTPTDFYNIRSLVLVFTREFGENTQKDLESKGGRVQNRKDEGLGLVRYEKSKQMSHPIGDSQEKSFPKVVILFKVFLNFWNVTDLKIKILIYKGTTYTLE